MLNSQDLQARGGAALKTEMYPLWASESHYQWTQCVPASHKCNLKHWHAKTNWKNWLDPDPPLLSLKSLWKPWAVCPPALTGDRPAGREQSSHQWWFRELLNYCPRHGQHLLTSGNIRCHPDDVFFGEGVAYFSKMMPNHIKYILQQDCSTVQADRCPFLSPV